MSLRYLDVCSGYSAATIAWRRFGWECVGYAEIDPAPCAVLAHRFGATRPRYMPDPEADGLSVKERRNRLNAIKALDTIGWGNRVVNFGDFTQIREDDVGPIDLLSGGTPCQDFSVAGRRLGLDGPRGLLTIEFLHLARRLRPRRIVWENVTGVLSADGGRAFGAFLGALGELGYGFAYRSLDAQFIRVGGLPWAVPQRRRRVFLVADLGGWTRAAAVLFDRSSLRGDSAPRRETGQAIAGTLKTRAGGGGHPDVGDGHDIHLVPVTGPLRAGGDRSGHSFQDADGASSLLPEVGATLEATAGRSRGAGTPPGMVMPEVSPTLRAGGNETGGHRPPGTDVDTVETLQPIYLGNAEGGTDEVPFLTASNLCKTVNNQTPLIGVPDVADPVTTTEGRTYTHEGSGNFRTRNVLAVNVEHGLAPHGSLEPTEIAPPLTGSEHKGHTVAFSPEQITHPENRSSPTDLAPTLASERHPPAVAFTCKDHGQDAGEVSPTLRSMGHQDSHANGGGQVAVAFQPRIARNGRGQPEEICPTLNGTNAGATSDSRPVAAISQGSLWRVRRLTPRECERLQGVPDDFTLVPYRGGKPMSDSARYKMLGNSWAANVGEWVGWGIEEVERICSGN